MQEQSVKEQKKTIKMLFMTASCVCVCCSSECLNQFENDNNS